ncbi:MAG: hypothetical protein JSS27_14890 [Planctomycetes bacterium]|nr:hypothetical protein [Planctomycetota bacterium]
MAPAYTVAGAEPAGDASSSIRFQVSEPLPVEHKATPPHVLRVPDRVTPPAASAEVQPRTTIRIAQVPAIAPPQLPAAAQPKTGRTESSLPLKPSWALIPSQDLSIDIRPTAGELPPNAAAAILGQPEYGRLTRGWNNTVFTWEPPGVCHRPVYFEQVNVERYGYTAGVLQPGISAAHFFLTIPLLPYKVGAQPRRECVYTLGYYRPGSRVPYQRERLPISVRGLLFETATVTGIVFFVPP